MRRLFCILLTAALFLSLTACAGQHERILPYTELGESTIPEDIKEQAVNLPAASADALPQWHGLEYEIMGDYPDGYQYYGFSALGFAEQDIQNVAELGFNFLRVPVNTKFYFENADVNQGNVENWENLDDLISWGIQYGVHISIVVCETYGHNCAYSQEESTLFQNEEQMNLFITFWDTVAKRYADIPNNALSFNILNEPCDYIGEDVYCEMALKVAEVIRTHTPDRLIISDMFAWGSQPLYGLVGSGIVQSIHFYEPEQLNSGMLRQWPCTAPLVNSSVYGGGHFTLRGEFPAGTTVSLEDYGLTTPGKLMFAADGTEFVMFDPKQPELGVDGCTELFSYDAGEGRYAGYHQEISVTLEDDASVLELYHSDPGGTVDIGAVFLHFPNGNVVTVKGQYYDVPQGEAPMTDVTVGADGNITDNHPVTEYNTVYDIDWIREALRSYSDFAEETGTTVFLNEFGVPVTVDYNATLAYLDDLLTVADEYGWSWSMYDYIGPFCLVKGTNPEHVRDGAVYEAVGSCEVDTGLYDVLKKHF